MTSHDPKPLSARLTPDEAERLAAGFRPSWELDDAPFTGAGTLSATDMVALQGGGTLAEVRAKAGPVVGSRPPPAALVAPEPETKVIVDDTEVTAPPPMALLQEVGEPAGTHGPNGRAVMAMAAPPVPTQHSAPPAAAIAAMTAPDLGGGRHSAAKAPIRPRAMSLGEDSVALPTVFRPKRARMWMSIGAVGVAVLGLGVWAVTGSGGQDAKATAPPSGATVEAKAATAAPTRLGTDTPAAPSSTAALAPGSTPAPQVTPTQTPAPPTATPVPTNSPAPRAVVAAPAAPRAAVAAAPSPAPKPHSKPTTIVRDVPF